MSAKKVRSNIQLIDNNNNIIYSALKISMQKSSSALVKEAFTSGKISSGVEISEDGRLVNVLAFPLYKGGKATGLRNGY